MTVRVTNWRVCAEGCCVVVEDSDLPAPQMRVIVARPMYQLLYDHLCPDKGHCAEEWGRWEDESGQALPGG